MSIWALLLILTKSRKSKADSLTCLREKRAGLQHPRYPDPMDCIFCKIIDGTIPSKKLYEDDRAYAFADIDPKAPVHVLIVPKKHIPSLAETEAVDTPLLGHLHVVAKKLAAEHQLSGGYRTVVNTGLDGGQTVFHLHLHLLGGRQMHWPPG